MQVPLLLELAAHRAAPLLEHKGDMPQVFSAISPVLHPLLFIELVIHSCTTYMVNAQDLFKLASTFQSFGYLIPAFHMCQRGLVLTYSPILTADETNYSNGNITSNGTSAKKDKKKSKNQDEKNLQMFLDLGLKINKADTVADVLSSCITDVNKLFELAKLMKLKGMIIAATILALKCLSSKSRITSAFSDSKMTALSSSDTNLSNSNVNLGIDSSTVSSKNDIIEWLLQMLIFEIDEKTRQDIMKKIIVTQDMMEDITVGLSIARFFLEKGEVNTACDMASQVMSLGTFTTPTFPSCLADQGTILIILFCFFRA